MQIFLSICTLSSHSHTSHFCSYTHQSCGCVNHYRIGYKVHNWNSNTTDTHTTHIITNATHILFMMRIFRFTAGRKKKEKNYYLCTQSMWTWWKMQRLVAWKTFLIISIMIWTINKFNSKLNLNKKKWKIEKEKKRKTHETETSFSHTEEYRRLGRIGCMHLHANPINIQTHTYEYVEREHCSVNAFIISFPRKFSKVLPH